MSAYVFPIKTALILFPFLAFFLALPILIKEYRKYGALPFIKGFLMYSFIFYLLCAYFLVMLPLPDKAVVAKLTTPYIQLIPFANLGRFLDQTVLQINNPGTYLAAMKQGVFLEPVFNIFLTIPFGIYLRYYFKVSLKKTILYSFCLSLFFELTQLSGLYFIYPRPYRLADVDDLINNTLGGVIGFALAPLVEKVFPTREEINQKAYAKGQQVTLLRRGLALVIDLGLLAFFKKLILIGVGFLFKVNLDENSFPVTLFFLLLYFVGFAAISQGQTLGKKLVAIQVVGKDQQPATLWSLFKRYLYLYLPLEGILFTFATFNRLFNEANVVTHPSEITLVYLGLTVVSFLILVLFFVILGIEHFLKHPFYYERLSKTQEINRIKKHLED